MEFQLLWRENEFDTRGTVDGLHVTKRINYVKKWKNIAFVYESNMREIYFLLLRFLLRLLVTTAFKLSSLFSFFFFGTLSRLFKFVLSFLRMKQIILHCKNLENDDSTVAKVRR